MEVLQMELTRKQSEGLKIAIERYRHGEKYTVIAGYAGSGKAQPVDTLIPTPTGWKQLGTLKVGDYVFDRLGKPTRVLGVYPQGILPVFKVTLKDGRSTLCNDEHLWSYFNQHGDRLLTASLKSIQARGLINNSGSYKIKIPRNKPIEYPFKALPVDPYVLGCFLGDGYCVSGPLAFSSTDEELVATISQRIGAKNYVRKNPQEYTWFFERQEPKGKNTRYI